MMNVAHSGTQYTNSKNSQIMLAPKMIPSTHSVQRKLNSDFTLCRVAVLMGHLLTA